MPPSLTLVEPKTEPQSLPHNVAAEAALLGALMIDNRLFEDVQMRVGAEHFHDPLHGRIFEQIRRLIDRNMLANPVTMKPMLEADAELKEKGGAAYLAELTGSGAPIIGARDFAQQIYDLAQLRALISVGRDMVERAMDTSEDVAPAEQIEQAESALYRVAEQGGSEGGVKSFGRASLEALQNAEKALNAGGGLSGLTTGINALNVKTGGFHHSDLLILAGRPGMGKTALATNIAFNTAQKWVEEVRDGVEEQHRVGAPVVFFSLEMSADQLATRILSEQSQISSEALRMGKITREDFQRLAQASGKLQGLPLYIDDTAGLTIASMRTRARRLKRQHNIGMIVVDYLQLLQGTGKGGDQNRVQEISEISRGLKTLAKELHVPVLALSQLSRQVEQREDKRPQLSDLRESGSIEQDADIVMFVYREEYYLAAKEPREGSDDAKSQESYQEWQRQMSEVFGRAEVIVAKQRHGSTGKVPLHFEARYTRFGDLAETAYMPEPRG